MCVSSSILEEPDDSDDEPDASEEDTEHQRLHQDSKAVNRAAKGTDSTLSANTGESSRNAKLAKGAKEGKTKERRFKIKAEYGTKRQGLHWITYAARHNLDSQAHLEEIITMRQNNARAEHNARRKALKQEERTLKAELKVKKINLRRLELMTLEAILLDLENRLADKENEKLLLQEKHAKLELEKSKLEEALEKEKTQRMKAEEARYAAQEKFERARLESNIGES
ncbi:hypothetical protein BN14_06586 [Rhizoctonia solani AG-1 IB]|uniref:Uncharacterized protein n=2 Tax=Thanatephorus cucumeris (strain AG1-IB / isolate 7/3/14) TaxID=1108050 RepID=M5C0P5_THACB|nr:hypothetical protein BN14_06586 [Rhizoctonia solani AG-1 IB]